MDFFKIYMEMNRIIIQFVFKFFYDVYLIVIEVVLNKIADVGTNKNP